MMHPGKHMFMFRNILAVRNMAKNEFKWYTSKSKMNSASQLLLNSLGQMVKSMPGCGTTKQEFEEEIPEPEDDMETKSTVEGDDPHQPDDDMEGKSSTEVDEPDDVEDDGEVTSDGEMDYAELETDDGESEVRTKTKEKLDTIDVDSYEGNTQRKDENYESGKIQF